jgi:hypothetical protein
MPEGSLPLGVHKAPIEEGVSQGVGWLGTQQVIVRFSRKPNQALEVASLEITFNGSDEGFQNIFGMSAREAIIVRALDANFKPLYGRPVTTDMLGKFRTLKMRHGIGNGLPFSRLPLNL